MAVAEISNPTTEVFGCVPSARTSCPLILQDKYEHLTKESLALVGNTYHIVEPFKVCASSFGAATARSRVFFVGILKSSGVSLTSSDFQRPPCPNTTVRTAFAGLPRESEA